MVFGGTTTTEVSCGQRMQLNGVQQVPTVTFTTTTTTTTRPSYHMIMFDPDAPSRDHPVMADWLHWLKVDVTVGSEGEVKEGDVVMHYAPPSPPFGSGPHRYVLINPCDQNFIPSAIS